MRRRVDTPPEAQAEPEEDESGKIPAEVQDRLKKTGVDYSDLARLVAAVRSGADWDEVKRTAGAGIRDRVLEAWKATIYERAEQVGERVLPSKSTEGAQP